MPAAEAERIVQEAANKARAIERERAARDHALRVRLLEIGLADVPPELAAIAASAERRGIDPVEVIRRRQQQDQRRAEHLAAAQEAARRLANRKLYVDSCVPLDMFDRAKFGDMTGVPADVRSEYARVASLQSRLFGARGIQLVYGPPGTGKTWMSCALIRGFCQHGLSCRFVTFSTYLKTLRATYRASSNRSELDVEREFTQPKLLVIDEFDLSKDTEFCERELTGLILDRHRNEGRTIVLSNLAEHAFLSRIDEKVKDRTHDEAGGIIRCDWRSLRGATTLVMKIAGSDAATGS